MGKIITTLDIIDERQKQKAKRRAARERRKRIQGWNRPDDIVLKPKPIKVDIRRTGSTQTGDRTWSCPRCNGKKKLIDKFFDPENPRADKKSGLVSSMRPCNLCGAQGQIWI